MAGELTALSTPPRTVTDTLRERRRQFAAAHPDKVTWDGYVIDHAAWQQFLDSGDTAATREISR